MPNGKHKWSACRTRNCSSNPGMEDRAAKAWATASRAHLNRDFRFNSQPLGTAFTEQASIGGRAWPNIVFDNQRFDYPFMIWANSTLGLICFWWHSNRQVAGRGSTTVSAVDSLSILDLRALTDAQLRSAEDIFRRVPGQGPASRIPRRRRPQPSPAGPPRHL